MNAEHIIFLLSWSVFAWILVLCRKKDSDLRREKAAHKLEMEMLTQKLIIKANKQCQAILKNDAQAIIGLLDREELSKEIIKRGLSRYIDCLDEEIAVWQAKDALLPMNK